MNDLTPDSAYRGILESISAAYASGRSRAAQGVDTQLTETYWQIGRDIFEFEQGGKVRADDGNALLTSLAKDLTLLHGKGLSRSYFSRSRRFCQAFPVYATLSHKWSGSVICEMLTGLFSREGIA